MITTQKVAAILKKAGYTFSKYEASGMVRGWGSSTDGYSVRKRGDQIRVDYRGKDHLERIAEAAQMLRAAGLTVEEDGSDYGAWLYVTPPAALRGEGGAR